MAYLPRVEFQPYIKPYAGSANQELADTVKTLTQRYDQNLEQSTALDIIAGQTAASVVDGDREIVNSKIANVRSQLDAIAKSDSGYYTARPRIAQIASQFKGDPDLAIMMANKKIYDEEQEANNRLRAAGQKVLDFGDRKFKSVSYDDKGQKVYNTYRPGSEMMHNYHDAQSKFFDQLQADAGSGGISQSAMQGFLQTGSWQGISGAKVKAQAQRAIQSYLNTPEGNQQLRNYTKLQGMTTDQALKAIEREFISTGMERTFSQSQTNYMQDPYAIIAARGAAKSTSGKKGKDGAEYALEAEAESPHSNKDNTDAVIYHLSNGKLNPYSKLSDVQKDILRNSIAQAKAELGPTASKEAIVRQAKTFARSREAIRFSPSFYSISGTENVNNENNTFRNGNYSARHYLDPENPGKTIDWTKLKDRLGMSDVSDDKVLKAINVTGYYNHDNLFTDGLSGEKADRFVQPLRLTVDLGNGQTKTIVAGSDLGSTKTAEFQKEKFLHEIYKGDRTGRGKRVNAGGKTLYLKPTYKPVQIPMPDGSIVEEEGIQVMDMDGRSQVAPVSSLFHTLNQQ